jgi:hypothetical protein
VKKTLRALEPENHLAEEQTMKQLELLRDCWRLGAIQLYRFLLDAETNELSAPWFICGGGLEVPRACHCEVPDALEEDFAEISEMSVRLPRAH